MKLEGLDEFILLAVQQQGEGAYGVTVQAALQKAGRNPSVSTLYGRISVLEKGGLLEGRQGDPIAERGGKSRRYYRITGEGYSALREVEAARAQLSGLGLVAGGAA